MNKRALQKLIPFMQAWLDGKEIQYRTIPNGSWTWVSEPEWADFVEYRIKPDKQWYRVAKMDSYCGIASSLTEINCSEEMLERDSRFRKWLSPRVEFEV